MKKLVSLILAIMMIAAVGAAFATSMDLANDGVDGSKTNTTTNTSVTIYKELTAFNPSATTINAPTISYSYAISGDVTIADSATITDSDSIAVKPYAGSTATSVTPSITSSVGWTPAETLTASSTGAANKKPLTVSFTGTFPRAGVYRYLITETITNAAYTAAGVVNGTISNTRYLDVYVKDENVIYGYVLTDANNTATSTSTTKTEGFVATTGDGALTADQYHTFNLTISKTVSNDNYIKTTHHQFPFTVTFTNATVTGAVKPIVTATANATLAQADAVAIASFTATAPTIADGASVTYTGIPMGTVVSIVEQNNVTGTTYAVTTTGADMNISTAEAVTSGNSTTGTIAITAQTAGSEADKTVAVTNDMQIISPTGYVSRVAPYALILVGGIFLLIIATRRKHTAEE